MPKLIGISQLVTIMGRINNKFLPCIWVLMSGRTEIEYIRLFRYLKDSVLKDLNVSKIISDYEFALQNAIKTVFPHCTLMGCYFHYVYNVRKYAKKLKIYSILKGKSVKVHIKGIFLLRKLFNLPLLPSSYIKTGFEIIKNNINASNDLKEIVQFIKLIRYIEDFWMKKVDANVLSVFQCERRTNNNQERYHKSLNEMMRHRPTLYKFILKLKDLIIKTVIQISQLNNGKLGKIK
ncbi:uncharacterized protein [Prorops nasuta]|uniref:uncharacterized protein n=1 Tax=Prorops nasuta TaxID=863751 RepID=UPI0034D0179F